MRDPENDDVNQPQMDSSQTGSGDAPLDESLAVDAPETDPAKAARLKARRAAGFADIGGEV